MSNDLFFRPISLSALYGRLAELLNKSTSVWNLEAGVDHYRRICRMGRAKKKKSASSGIGLETEAYIYYTFESSLKQWRNNLVLSATLELCVGFCPTKVVVVTQGDYECASSSKWEVQSESNPCRFETILWNTRWSFYAFTAYFKLKFAFSFYSHSYGASDGSSSRFLHWTEKGNFFSRMGQR